MNALVLQRISNVLRAHDCAFQCRAILLCLHVRLQYRALFLRPHVHREQVTTPMRQRWRKENNNETWPPLDTTKLCSVSAASTGGVQGRIAESALVEESAESKGTCDLVRQRVVGLRYRESRFV
jgi:hypothetical protein